MINTSIDYRRAVEKNRQFILQDKIIFDNKKSLTLSMEDVTAYSINEASSGNGKFEIGAAIVKEYKASLNNMDGKFDGIEFEGADISAKIGLLLQGGSYEYLKKGEFRIVEAKERDLTIDIKAYDGMLYFDKPYSESTLRYPATVNQILSDACISCQMTLNARSVQMGSLVVRERPDDEAVTFRDIISFCAQIMGCYAVINNLGQLEFRWYDFAMLDSLRDDWYDGGGFDKGMPYATGDTADGGRFNPWDTGAVIDGGSFTGQGEYHHAYLLKSQSINTNDVTITGISVTVKQGTDGQEKTYLYGQEGYVLELSGNLLVQEENVQAVLQHVGQKITGNTFRPLSVSAQSDPSIEAGDLVIVTDRKQKSYLTVVTNTTFSLSGSQKIECSAETPTEKNYTRYGAVTKLISSSKDKMNQMVNQQLSAYDIASRQLSSLMARSMGLYETYDVQDDGSTIKYQHDKPNLSDSKTIWKQTQGAFAVSTDGGKTWNAGTDAEGNALFNVLSVIGFYFDWAKGGTLTLGGKGNSRGLMEVYDESGNLCGTIDAKIGMQMMKYISSNNIYMVNIKEVEYYDTTDKKKSRYGLCVNHPTPTPEKPYQPNGLSWGRISLVPSALFEYSNLIESVGRCDFSLRHRSKDEAFVPEKYLDFSGSYQENSKHSASFGIRKCMRMESDPNAYYNITRAITITWTPSTDKSGVGISTEDLSVGLADKDTTISLCHSMRNLHLKGAVSETTTYSANVRWRTSYGEMMIESSSSRRYKDIEREMSEEDIKNYYLIKPVIARYKEGYLNGSDARNGMYYPMFIAENIEEVIPEAVEYNEEGLVENWNHRVMIPAMFQMIKSQKETIDNQQAEIESLTERLKRLEVFLMKGVD